MEQPITEEEKLERKRAYMKEYMRNRRKTLLTEDGKSYDNYIARLNYDYLQRECLRGKNRNMKKKEWNEFKRSMPKFLTS
jgi:hypothetical protein